MVGLGTWRAVKGPTLVQQWSSGVMRNGGNSKVAGATSTDQSWRHPRNNWVRGFEGALVRICGAGWKDLANADHQLWMGQRAAFVAEAVRIWGGPRLVGSARYVEQCR